MRWIAEAVRRRALGWLLRSGGWRRRRVVVGGRRREARLWDPKVSERLDLRFTAGPLRLLVAAMEASPGLPSVPPSLRAEVCAGATGPEPATGDLLALHLLGEALLAGGVGRFGADGEGPARSEAGGGALRERRPEAAGREDAQGEERAGAGASAEGEEDLVLSLRSLSPLGLAFDPEALGGLASPGEASEEALAACLAPLFRGDRPVLLSYLDDALARAWLAAEERRRRLAPEAAAASYRAFARGLRAYARAADARPDALRPLLAFFERYLVWSYGGRAEVVRSLREQARGLGSASARDAFLLAASELFALGSLLEERASSALAAPYVDRSEAEKVFLADYQERYRDLAPDVEALRRELAGVLG